MPKYAPQSLPMPAARKTDQQPNRQLAQNTAAPAQHTGPAQPAIQLGQYVRRERGMQGVRAYVAALHDFLPPQEYAIVCKYLGVPQMKMPPKQQEPQRNAQKPPPKVEAAQQPNPANQMQMLHMLSQMMALQGGGGANPLAGGADGGMNPVALMQMLNALQSAK